MLLKFQSRKNRVMEISVWKRFKFRFVIFLNNQRKEKRKGEPFPELFNFRKRKSNCMMKRKIV